MTAHRKGTARRNILIVSGAAVAAFLAAGPLLAVTAAGAAPAHYTRYTHRPHPTHTPTPTSTPTAPTSAPSTVSPTPTTTAPTTPSGSVGAGPNGVPAGTVLTVYTGPTTCSAGTLTIHDQTVNNDLTTTGSCQLVVTDSLINGQVDGCDSQPNCSVYIADSEVNGGNNTGAAVGYNNLTLLRDNIHGGASAVDAAGNVTVDGSHLWGQYLGPNAATHNNGFLSNGGSNLTLTNSTVACDVNDNTSGGGCTGPIALFGDFAQISNATIDNNYVVETPGGYSATFGCNPGKSYPTPAGVTVAGNVFQIWSTPQNNGGFYGGYYGTVTGFYDGNGDVWGAGNVTDSGSPVDDPGC